MPDILYLLPFVFTSTLMFLLIQYLLKKRRNRYAELEQNELSVVNHQPPPPLPSSPISTRSQMAKGRMDEIVIDIYNEQEGGDHECSICLFEFKDQELFRCLPACNHGFHFECIKTWLDMSQTYPLCRRSTAYHRDLLEQRAHMAVARSYTPPALVCDRNPTKRPPVQCGKEDRRSGSRRYRQEDKYKSSSMIYDPSEIRINELGVF
ncbi:RING-H2 finger protein ATL39-like [Olea europaea var. sylvestris]|uniref:RING-H2 finger protein ATL39-like n=1 Tax=Olea europaea var. sylvestris TaxID=158386 RepID=UPI000C1D673C|nr:RING-H2 finger protein ATL39-like [Olea europaea var. sylvestris]